MFTSHLGEIPTLALASVRAFPQLTLNGRLHRSRAHLGATYQIEDAGTFAVFRETDSATEDAGRPCVLVVGFRLKAIRSFRLLHWLFQRVCLLTTPFWSGLPGFKVKLWMVDPTSKNYLGIYDWRGEADARRYVDALVRVLAPLSNRGSVWYRLYPDEELDTYLAPRSV